MTEPFGAVKRLLDAQKNAATRAAPSSIHTTDNIAPAAAIEETGVERDLDPKRTAAAIVAASKKMTTPGATFAENRAGPLPKAIVADPAALAAQIVAAGRKARNES